MQHHITTHTWPPPPTHHNHDHDKKSSVRQFLQMRVISPTLPRVRKKRKENKESQEKTATDLKNAFLFRKFHPNLSRNFFPNLTERRCECCISRVASWLAPLAPLDTTANHHNWPRRSVIFLGVSGAECSRAATSALNLDSD